MVCEASVNLFQVLAESLSALMFCRFENKTRTKTTRNPNGVNGSLNVCYRISVSGRSYQHAPSGAQWKRCRLSVFTLKLHAFSLWILLACAFVGDSRHFFPPVSVEFSSCGLFLFVLSLKTSTICSCYRLSSISLLCSWFGLNFIVFDLVRCYKHIQELTKWMRLKSRPKIKMDENGLRSSLSLQ